MWVKRAFLLILVLSAVFSVISPVAADNRSSGDLQGEIWSDLSVENIDEFSYFIEYPCLNDGAGSLESQVIFDEKHFDFQLWAHSGELTALNKYLHYTYSLSFYEIIPDLISFQSNAVPAYDLYKMVCNGIYRYELSPGINIPESGYFDENVTFQKFISKGEQSGYFCVDVPEDAENILINLNWTAGCDDLFLVVYPPDGIIGPLYDSRDEKDDNAINIDISGKNSIPSGKWYFKVENSVDSSCNFNFSCYYRS